MIVEQAMDRWLGDVGTVLLPARTAVVESRVSVEEILSAVPSESATAWRLRCDFAEGGPWAGARDLFRSLFDDIWRQSPALVEKHDYELVHVVPELKARLSLRNPCLTDTAPSDERIRNYPSDRAHRIVHGLIDLLAEYKRESCPETAWLLVCLDYDRAGEMAQRFFRELMRRRGNALRVVLLPVFTEDQLDTTSLGFACALRELPFAVSCPVAETIDACEAARRAEALEPEIGDDILGRTARLPDIIRLWRLAGREDKLLQTSFRALHSYNALGFYRDSIRYGEVARDLVKRSPLRAEESTLPWWVFFKLFLAYLAAGETQSALDLAQESDFRDPKSEEDEKLRVPFCYTIAMLYARFLSARDLALGEEYLAKGLEHLDKAGFAEPDYWFQYVFNRNGLAMIRSFQGRFQEALEICRTGFRILDERLSKDRHHLHRSVLLYNMAQVHNQIGNHELAIQHYSAAMQMDPNYSEYYNERGSLYLKLGRLEEAELDYLRAIELSAPYFEVWTNLANCYMLQGRLDEATLAFSKALDLKPAQPASLFGRAQVREALGASEEALADYTAALELNPMYWQARAGRAVLLYEAGRIVECLVDLDQAISLAPGEADLYQNRAVALADLQRHQEARDDLEKYLALYPAAGDRKEIEARLDALDATKSPEYAAR
jgi:tetratricopeptide (TPR) repeat protein